MFKDGFIRSSADKTIVGKINSFLVPHVKGLERDKRSFFERHPKVKKSLILAARIGAIAIAGPLAGLISESSARILREIVRAQKI